MGMVVHLYVWLHIDAVELLLSSQCRDGFNFIDGIDVQYDRSVESP